MQNLPKFKCLQPTKTGRKTELPLRRSKKGKKTKELTVTCDTTGQCWLSSTYHCDAYGPLLSLLAGVGGLNVVQASGHLQISI